MRKISSSLLCAFIGFLLLRMDCEEPLPPYEEPQDVFASTLQTSPPGLETIRRDTMQVLEGKGGMGFTVDVSNLFDETFADTAREPLGEIQIWWVDDASVSRMIPLLKSDEVVTDEINSLGYLIFDPGETLRFAVNWRWWDDNGGQPMWSHLDKTWVSGALEYPTMEFAAQAKIHLFDRLPAVNTAVIRFTVTFYGE